MEQLSGFDRSAAVTPAKVAALMTNGRIDLLEDQVQSAFEDVIGETFHMKDHGGEECDMFSTRIRLVDDDRAHAAAFLLKGRGTRSQELQIADCGHNGDQIVRLLQTPADLYVIQYVGPVSLNVMKDLRGKIRERRAEGREASYCIVDGTDTARLMVASGHLQVPEAPPADASPEA